MTTLSRRSLLNAAATLPRRRDVRRGRRAVVARLGANGDARRGREGAAVRRLRTLVDWRNGVANEARRILAPLGYNLDWLALADAWVVRNEPGMRICAQQQSYVRIDVLQRRRLEQLRPRLDSRSSTARPGMSWHWPARARRLEGCAAGPDAAAPPLRAGAMLERQHRPMVHIARRNACRGT